MCTDVDEKKVMIIGLYGMIRCYSVKHFLAEISEKNWRQPMDDRGSSPDRVRDFSLCHPNCLVSTVGYSRRGVSRSSN
jgi:hypothetical protein